MLDLVAFMLLNRLQFIHQPRYCIALQVELHIV